mmetsp:Transcript_6272/g.12070  ORF Transcript_6272/g.12070 Transcript_6272/m.12070 type:complete len:92 (+) Transcript_6272:295-570(+)
MVSKAQLSTFHWLDQGFRLLFYVPLSVVLCEYDAVVLEFSVISPFIFCLFCCCLLFWFVCCRVDPATIFSNDEYRPHPAQIYGREASNMSC